MGALPRNQSESAEFRRHSLRQFRSILTTLLVLVVGCGLVGIEELVSQGQQIKILNALHAKKDAEIAELLRIRNMRSEEFAQLKSSMAVKTEMIRRVAVRVGVTESEIRTLIEYDPMAKP